MKRSNVGKPTTLKGQGDTQEFLGRVRRICLGIPGAEERLSHASPTFFLRKKVFVIFDDHHHGANRIAVWVPAEPGQQEALVAAQPQTYFRPPYVGVKGWIGINLDRLDDEDLSQFILRAAALVLMKKPKRA